MIDGWLHQLLLEAPSILLSILLAGGIVLLGTWWLSKPGDERRSLVVLVLALATVGAIVGYSGGISRTSVVGDIMPAALGLVGAVALYVFGVDRSRGLIAPICAAAFALALGLGYATGSGQRGDNDRRDAWVDTCRTTFTNPAILSDDAAFTRASRAIGQPCARTLADEEARGLDEASKYDKSYSAAHDRLERALDPATDLQRSSLDTWVPICHDLVTGKLPQGAWSELAAKTLAGVCPALLAVELEGLQPGALQEQALDARESDLKALILAAPTLPSAPTD